MPVAGEIAVQVVADKEQDVWLGRRLLAAVTDAAQRKGHHDGEAGSTWLHGVSYPYVDAIFPLAFRSFSTFSNDTVGSLTRSSKVRRSSSSLANS